MFKFSTWRETALVLLAGLAWGCDIQGYHRPRDDGPSTAQFRYEAEFIPNAVLAREDTMPQWPLGRYAFKRGADRLLVVSRITSFGDKTSARDDGAPLRRYDKLIERVWITLPLGTQIGEVLMLKDLEWDFLVGYDEGDLETGLIYIQPNRVIGTVKILEERSDAVVIDINMVVEPKRLTRWDDYRGVMTVPVTQSGIRAKPIQQGAALEPFAGQDNAGGGQQSGPSDHGAGVGAATTQPGQDSSGSTLEKSDLVGRWECPRSGDPGHNKWFDYRFQFESTGRFVFASQQVNSTTVMGRWGEYQIKGDYVILRLEMYSPLDRMDNNLQAYKSPYVALKVSKEGDGLVVVGAPDETQGNQRLILERSELPSLPHRPIQK